MNQKQIESFLCVAENLNMSLSAQKLYSSQSSISKQIRQLEEEIGLQLFVRGHNYLNLTPAGKVMYKTFGELKEIYNFRLKDAQTLNDGREGTLRFALYSYMRLDFFAELVREFQQIYPNIVIDNECVSIGSIDALLCGNEYDFVLMHDFDQIDNPDFIYCSICSTRQFLLYSANHPLAKKRDISVTDFRGEVFWRVNTRCEKMYQENQDRIFAHYGLENVKLKLAPNIDTVFFNVSLSQGVCFLDSCTGMLNNRQFRKLMLDREVGDVEILMGYNRNNMNPAIPLFLNSLSTELRHK